MATDKHEQIRKRAYEIWENEGRPEGSHLRHWQQAVDELDGEDEHETLQDLIDEDDRDDAALLQGAGESGDFDKPHSATSRGSTAKKSKAETANPEITTGEKPARQKMKKTEGP
ncbi:MAG: DUF2934 domain-containing protein [Rhizobiaceae bacterium]|nr:DUF2934 domain-containing protein [Rhizobiaceae bacterium]